MEHLIGAWRLLSFKIKNKSGEIKDWQSGGAEGLLIYSSNNMMSVSINDKPNTLKEVKDSEDILKRSLFYAGTYSVESSKIKHFVKYATNPARIDEVMVRSFKIEENILTLEANGDYGSSTIIWEKINRARLISD